MRQLFFFLGVFVSLFSFGQPNESQVIIGKHDSIYSHLLKEWRPLIIHLPTNYNDNFFQAARYPVLYLLDGEAHFNSVSGLIEILGGGINGTHVIPDMIVVAIPNTDRTRDLTPTHAETDNEGKEQTFLKSSGGNNNFLNFIKTELIPHIDSIYRTMPYRVLVGHSFGGITVVNALYTMPETFNAYLAIDPSLWWDHKVLLEKAKTFFQQSNLNGKILYLGQANTMVTGDTSINEHFEAIKEFATLLQTRNRSGIRWKYDYYPDDDHGSVPFISEYNGLRFFFEGYHIKTTEVMFQPDKLKDQFQKFSNETGVKFAPPEGVINFLGYNLLNSGKTDLAIKYFQMNIDYYPKSGNVYDSMGDALAKKGESTKAIESYRKSLSLNPNNQNAKEMISKIEAGKK